MIHISDHTATPPTHRMVVGEEAAALLARATGNDCHRFFFELGVSIRISDGLFVRKPKPSVKYSYRKN